MSGLLRASSRCKYSWWWDSHITPKNSKWLQENLTDMDSKIKAIIKLIEEDADSFAMRAEMYYKKRPELMQLVEEFYRAYRALAERYDNATGVIRQAQRTMVEAFPNQDPLGITEDLLASHHFQKGLSLLGGGDTEQLAEDKVRKGLDFYEDLSVSEVVSIFENEIQVLKDALSQLEIEKEAGIVQYEDSLEKVSKLEKVSRELTDRANKAEEEAHVLRDSIATLEAEKEATLLEYQNCLVNIANLEKNLSQAKDEASKATCEKDEALGRYEHSLEMILDLEMKLKRAEENAMDLMEGADNAEREVEDLKKVLAKLTTERESNILRSIEAETNLQKLQNLHSETQDQMRLLALELEKKSNEMSRITEENKSLKDSYELFEMEKFYFTDEKDTLASQRETTQQAVKALGKRQEKLEEKQPGLEKELESNISKLEEISFLLDTEKKRKSTSAQNNETQFAGMKVQICHLQEEVLFRTRAFEDELEKAMNYQFENLILRRCIEDLKENNPSLLIEDLSDKTKILDMEKETLIKELKIKNELWILSQNEANKLLELNRDLEKKVDKLASLNVSINRELEEANMITNNREYQIYKLAEENRELGVKLKKLKEELGLTTQLSDGEIYELQDRLTTKDAKIDLLEKKNGFLEGENGRLKSQLASYAPLVLSLKDSVSSLEYRTLCTKGQKHHNDGEKEVVSVNCKNGSADSKALDLNSELKDLQYKIKVIERTFIQKEKHAAKENSDTNTDLEIAKEGIDSLKLRTCTNREYSVPIYNKSDFKNEFTMKDIMLDKNSESSYELSRRLERKSRSKRVESWDSTDINHSIEFTTRKEKGLRSQNSKLGSSKIEAEKELGVDTLEISRTFSQRSQEATKTKIVERLNSDAQKLSNLQINVQDLLKKVEITEKGKKGKSVYKGDDDILIEQLEEAEEAIVKLFDYNGKLMRSVEKRSFSSNVNLGIDSEECASARRRKIAEQARKISEKVEKWQTKVQKIQTLMLETDKKETKGKLGVKETKKKVMLRDYLYVRLRTPSRELKKASSSFCVCVQPSTRGD